MASQIFKKNSILHVSLVSNSLDESIAFLTGLFDRKPDRIGGSADPAEANAQYRGGPSRASCRLAVWNFDNMYLEVIEPDKEPSAWRDYLDRHGPGLHHIAFEVSDMPDKIAKLEAKGLPLLQLAEFGGGRGRYAYVDAERQIGAAIELLEWY
ncbi:MAG: VOC family protein [Proteobacteria bacterium]|nr:VOC family protein [Pseudomonadota bacterium]MBI3496714.1 VOC family protein [Pseudomonadota bacterium]